MWPSASIQTFANSCTSATRSWPRWTIVSLPRCNAIPRSLEPMLHTISSTSIAIFHPRSLPKIAASRNHNYANCCCKRATFSCSRRFLPPNASCASSLRKVFPPVQPRTDPAAEARNRGLFSTDSWCGTIPHRHGQSARDFWLFGFGMLYTRSGVWLSDWRDFYESLLTPRRSRTVDNKNMFGNNTHYVAPETISWNVSEIRERLQ